MTLDTQYTENLVSVIIPVYNAEKYIAETLTSVLCQTYSAFEVVIVDDCSSDNSKAIIHSFADVRIKYHCLPQNGGAAVARNKALTLAQGQYVAFLDGDDVWVPEKLEVQIAEMQKNNVVFSFTAIDMVDENGVLLKKQIPVKAKVDYQFLLTNTMIATSTVVIDRKKMGTFLMPLRRSGQDYATWLMLLRKVEYAYGINAVYTHYRCRANSLSSHKLKSALQVFDIQTRDEKIGKCSAFIHTIQFGWHAFKKHFL